MPPFYGKKQSPSAFESFPLGKISPSYSGDQINVTLLPREACRASASPRRLGLDVFSPLSYSRELAVKIVPQPSPNEIGTQFWNFNNNRKIYLCANWYEYFAKLVIRLKKTYFAINIFIDINDKSIVSSEKLLYWMYYEIFSTLKDYIVKLYRGSDSTKQ